MTSSALRAAGFTACAMACVACLPDDRLKLPYDDVPRNVDDGWRIDAPGAQGFDPALLHDAFAHFYAEDEYVTARSLLVVRHGRLVAEAYCRDRDDLARRRALMSATKSVTSLLVGIAIDEGLIQGVEQTAYALMPDGFPDDGLKRSIRVDDLLTMRSGIAFSNDDFSLEMAWRARGDSVLYILDKAMMATPGTSFQYEDCNPHVVSGLVQRASGQTLAGFAQARLFGPLGIVDPPWEAARDGKTFGPYGLYLTPRELARLGQLVLDDGVWEGGRVVSEAWVEESTRKHVEVPDQPVPGRYAYGYYWWVIDELGGFTANGHGGQYVLVIPPKDLVVVMTAEPDTDGDEVDITFEQFIPLAHEIVSAAG